MTIRSPLPSRQEISDLKAGKDLNDKGGGKGKSAGKGNDAGKHKANDTGKDRPRLIRARPVVSR